MNPLVNNPLRTRSDFGQAVLELWAPLKPAFSVGKARVSLGRSGAHFSTAAAEFEGFARPLFGLAPLMAGGFDFPEAGMIVTGIANGSDPAHDEYWGDIDDRDQRLVESAAIGQALLLAKDRLWDPLTERQQENLARWLKAALTKRVADNNWHFFHVLASLCLEHCGVDHDLSVKEAALDRLDSFYLGEGWYSDGPTRRFDHYTPFAMHYYGLIYAFHASSDVERAKRFQARARMFARDFKTWFAADGASVPYGRSMTYRFAQAAFWAALATLDDPGLPWSELRGLWARHLRWWARHDFFDRDGVMPIGYLYPNLNMAEQYNSPGSPYWCMKAFLPLMLPADHPFWTATEMPAAPDGKVVASSVPGTLSFEAGGSRVLLVSLAESRKPLRASADKYGKFAYSSGFGFSIDHDRDGFLQSTFDNMLAFSGDCRGFSVRRDVKSARINDQGLFSHWSPEPGIQVETWLIAKSPWHLRLHRIVSDKRCYTIEGGFAIERTDAKPDIESVKNGLAHVGTNTAVSLALDLSTARRSARIHKPLPNSALYFPRTHVPQLSIIIEPGETWLAGAYAASLNPNDGPNWLQHLPTAPEPATLFRLRDKGSPVLGLKEREAQPMPQTAWLFG